MSRTIVVTGGGRGIGAAVAALAGARGWRVALSYVANADAAEAAVAAARAAGGEATAVQGDVADEAALARLFDRAEDAFGTVDGVVANAGVIGRRMKLVEMSAERISETLRVNTFGALLTAREAARRMAARGGALVFIGSAAARLGSAGEFVDYAASKGALDSLTLGLAKELAPAIRVNCVRPGLIETDIHAAAGWPERAAALGATTPLGRAGTPEETAEAALWLLSDQASYVTGALLDVAGGR